jgi:hypothetical protein
LYAFLEKGEMRPIKLIFHPKETCFPIKCFRTKADMIWFPMDATSYSAETYQFVYKENPAIGLCGVFPKSECLGYHFADIERITYFYSTNTGKLVRVMLSAHSNEYHLLTILESQDDSNSDDPLTFYVAKGSHAFYMEKGIHWRIMGFLNDICSNGKSQIFNEDDVSDLSEPTTLQVPYDLTIDPTSQSPSHPVLSKWQRFWLPFYSKK